MCSSSASGADAETLVSFQKALVVAAEEAGVKRFVPSEWPVIFYGTVKYYGMSCFTRMQDAAAHVVKALDVPKRNSDTYIVGDGVSYKDIAEIAEEVTDEEFAVQL
ncbi:uncharacterized protein Z518_05358 [Rhinocladiella mackenziei CBS 650.93]|uniref:NmrA-like domain-containing protein n=1 Tax=Rhinocladiella mackenziei CBS 650.93 TaxID=1442369 RepID=A0A0D2H262_9EURO|nr:uncharacterized protein Z518_05358 [Rhinocladiella mackenziei CBS 650.93]KIX04488.1 hypothetical protein Z518_05358 [Rhinocladiella mackenziei CBS 650.93]